MKTDELREKYLAFFETKGHKRVPSDVLVPTWQPARLQKLFRVERLAAPAAEQVARVHAELVGQFLGALLSAHPCRYWSESIGRVRQCWR